jgi:uncharacterized RDD family membrane protein YckC
MIARVERVVPAKAVRAEQVIVDFAAERLKAPFLLRCGAILIDYILLIFIPVGSLLIGRLMNIESSKLLNSKVSNTGWLITILLALTNFVIFPMFSGQSIGKMLTGLRVVRTDGKVASFSQLLVRHSIGYLLTIATVGIGFLFSILNQKGRALHDFLAGTVVVYGRRRTEKKEI